jgi:hypothetical protein
MARDAQLERLVNAAIAVREVDREDVNGRGQRHRWPARWACTGIDL